MAITNLDLDITYTGNGFTPTLKFNKFQKPSSTAKRILNTLAHRTTSIYETKQLSEELKHLKAVF